MRDHRDPPVDGASRPTKLAGRRPKVSIRKQSQKASRRSLSSELSSSEDASKELAGIRSLSEALDANPDGEITEVTDDNADILPESSTINNSEIASLGVDDPENLLVTARKQVLESLEANCQSKELLDKLVKSITDILSHLSKERAQFDGLISHLLLVSFLCLVVGILLVIVFSSGSEDSYSGNLAT